MNGKSILGYALVAAFASIAWTTSSPAADVRLTDCERTADGVYCKVESVNALDDAKACCYPPEGQAFAATKKECEDAKGTWKPAEPATTDDDCKKK